MNLTDTNNFNPTRVLVLFSIAILLVSCRKPLKEPRNETLAKYVDSIENATKNGWQSDPVKAEKVILNMIDLYDSIGSYRGVIDKYSELSELYQYRKNDAVAALQAITKAMIVSSNHPEQKIENPYLFIDIGNLLYNNNLYEPAIRIYKETYNLALKSEATHPKILSLNNIGLSFAELMKHDSALKYFEMAQKHIPDTRDLLYAQAYIFRGEESFRLKKYDQIPLLIEQAALVLDQYRLDSLNQKKIDKENFRLWFFKLQARLTALQASVEVEHGNHDQAFELYKHAVLMATKSENTVFKGYLMTELLALPDLVPSELLMSDADTIVKIAQEANNLNLELKITQVVQSHFSTAGNKAESDKWQKKADSLFHRFDAFKNNDLYFNQNLLQTSSIMLLSLNSMLESRDKYLLTIQRQTLFILLLLVLLASTALFFILKSKLRKSNLALAVRTSEMIKLEHAENKSRLHSSERNSRLAAEFEELMVKEQFFTTKDISLTDLATLLNTNQTYLSQAINTQYGLNFKEVLNQMRIKAACRLLMSDFSNKFTIESLAGEVGFKSPSAFYTSFKKFTGVTPVEYRTLNTKRVPD